ncbi:MAG: hypothetical protein VW644_11265, partial [Alphaproteobacteria bacterium]
ATGPAAAQLVCGEAVTLSAHDGTTMTYSHAPAAAATPQGGTLVLLAGGGGNIGLDSKGCVTRLKGNSLVRMRDLFASSGFATALVDTSTDRRGTDGLGGFRLDPRHADDIGRIIADLRKRGGGPVFVIGTSRGTISAANAASRLSGDAAPDAVVLTSPVTAGNPKARKEWVKQSVFDVDLDAIRMPIFVVAHKADTCVRTPPGRADRILELTRSSREKILVVEGGPAATTSYDDLKACEGRTPHGYVGQERETVDAIADFLHSIGG